MLHWSFKSCKKWTRLSIMEQKFCHYIFYIVLLISACHFNSLIFLLHDAGSVTGKKKLKPIKKTTVANVKNIQLRKFWEFLKNGLESSVETECKGPKGFKQLGLLAVMKRSNDEEKVVEVQVKLRNKLNVWTWRKYEVSYGFLQERCGKLGHFCNGTWTCWDFFDIKCLFLWCWSKILWENLYKRHRNWKYFMAAIKLELKMLKHTVEFMEFAVTLIKFSE